MKKEYKYILWDIDDTLIDFKASESKALRKCFEEYGILIDEDDIEVYSKINREYWKLLEHGEIEKTIMLRRRFDDFIEYLSVDGVDGEKINQEYQLKLGDFVVMYDDGYEICSQLQGIKKQYAITNGTIVAQEKKLKNTGLDKIFDGVFISDKIGHQKPHVEFFEYVFENIPDFKAEEAIIIGDSLSSDIQGANNMGVDCCWFNSKEIINSDLSLQIKYEIKNLKEIMGIIF